MKPKALSAAICSALLLTAHPAAANEPQDLGELRDTVLNLVDALVKQGVLDKNVAENLVKKAAADAAAKRAQANADDSAGAAEHGSETVADKTDNAAAGSATPGGDVRKAGASAGKVVRVTYVPDIVKQEIRDQVRAELRQDVLSDVELKAKQEKWGTPDALPAWINKIKISGDARVRNELASYGAGNADTLSANNLYLDILKVNAAGGTEKAGTAAHLNTSQDADRWRERVRLDISAAIADHWTFDTRIATGNQLNPVSTNVTLGSTGQRFGIQLDRAQIRYDRAAEQMPSWFDATTQVTVGRMSNPWVSTDLLWDEDLTFDGAAVNLRRQVGGEPGLGGLGSAGATVFATAGLFPLQQLDFSARDKWLAGGQLGGSYEFDNQNKLQIAGAYYDYIHITGRRNPLGSTIRNSTQPTFLQKGNLLFNIANDPNLDGGANDQIFALASDYKLLDVNFLVDLAHLAPYHVMFRGDIVKNLAFDRSEIRERTGGTTYLYPISDRTLGWQFDVIAGWPQITKFGDWQVSAGYRYLQRDAVLDAFTDSDFHLGGTDAKGYRLSAMYGLSKNVWMRAKWLSATAIDGPPLAIDVLQVDLNAKF